MKEKQTVIVETAKPDRQGEQVGAPAPARPAATPPKEIGGRDGPEPTRYGDWEVNGIVTDF